MKKRILIVIVLCGVFFVPLWSQNTMDVVYDYDNAGNRVLRHVLELRNMHTDSRLETGKYYVNKLSSVNVNAYPNPTQDAVRLEFHGCQEDTKVSLKLYDMQGKMLLEQEGGNRGMTVNLEGRPAGVYILDLVVGEARTSWKIIKR